MYGSSDVIQDQANQIATLTRERDEARTELAQLCSMHRERLSGTCQVCDWAEHVHSNAIEELTVRADAAEARAAQLATVCQDAVELLGQGVTLTALQLLETGLAQEPLNWLQKHDAAGDAEHPDKKRLDKLEAQREKINQIEWCFDGWSIWWEDTPSSDPRLLERDVERDVNLRAVLDALPAPDAAEGERGA